MQEAQIKLRKARAGEPATGLPQQQIMRAVAAPGGRGVADMIGCGSAMGKKQHPCDDMALMFDGKELRLIRGGLGKGGGQACGPIGIPKRFGLSRFRQQQRMARVRCQGCAADPKIDALGKAQLIAPFWM